MILRKRTESEKFIQDPFNFRPVLDKSSNIGLDGRIYICAKIMIGFVILFVGIFIGQLRPTEPSYKLPPPRSKRINGLPDSAIIQRTTFTKG
jgi:hypothetical protein